MDSDKRILDIDQGVNFRDLGGYQAAGGRTTCWKKLIRAGALSNLTPPDQQLLTDYGISTVIDLRSPYELKQYPDKVPFSCKYIHLPIFNDDETESQTNNQELQKAYSTDPRSGYLRMLYVYRRMIVDPQPQAAYRHFFDYLLAHGADETILFHCSAGKDRTGILAVLLLDALGVDSQTVRRDYLMTNPASIRRIDLRIQNAKQSRKGPAFVSSVHDLSTVSDDYFDQAMIIVNEVYGGVRAYLRDVVGIDKDMMAELRRIYTE